METRRGGSVAQCQPTRFRAVIGQPGSANHSTYLSGLSLPAKVYSSTKESVHPILA